MSSEYKVIMHETLKLAVMLDMLADTELLER